MTDQLPWDKYPTPAGPEPVEPELPYIPGPPEPGPARPPRGEPDPDVKALASDLLSEAMSYAKQVLGEIGKGHTVDVLNPTVTAETSAGRELVIADAKSRSWRTLVQGLIVDVVAAIAVVLATVTDIDPLVKESWVLIGVLLVKSVLSAVLSYFMRLRVTPTIKVPGKEYAVMPMPRPIINEEKELGP